MKKKILSFEKNQNLLPGQVLKKKLEKTQKMNIRNG